jgi:hypothetical protein
VSPLIRRKAATAAESVEPAAPKATTVPPEAAGARAYTAAKGRPTPKRTEASKARKAPPPKDNKEARTRMREKMRTERAEATEGMRRGDARFLPARDKGPIKKMVRDLVDSRRNVATYFLVGAFLVVLLTSGGMPDAVRFGGQILWLLMVVAILADVWLMSRLIRKRVRERFPDTTEKPPVFYGVMRSLQFRRMRAPKPQVGIGEVV